VTARKAAPRTDYMAMLDKRLKRMEDRVIKLIPRENNEKPNVTRAIVKPNMLTPQIKTITARKRSIAEVGVADWAERGGSVPEARNSIPQGTAPAKDREEIDTVQTEGRDKLPPPDLQTHLTEIYFEYVYGQAYHLLHKPSFMRRLQAGTVPPVLILALCAVSARFSNHPYFGPGVAFNRGEEWAAPAREIALRQYDTRNITILIVYLLLGLHEFGTRQGGRSWMFSGMALRMAYSLGLHSSVKDHESLQLRNERALTFTDVEIERRIMWSCFIMDRMNSSGTLRPMAASEKSLELALPIKESFFQMEIPGETVDLDGKLVNPKPCMPEYIAKVKSNLGVAAYTVRLIAILGRVVKYLNLGGRLKDDFRLWHPSSKWGRYVKQLEDFNENLPADLLYNSENLHIHAAENIANQFIYMHIIYNQIVCLLYRYAIPGLAAQRLPPDQPADFSPKGRVHAFGAAAKISELVEEGTKHRLVVPFSGYCAYYSSVVHVYGAVSPDTTYRESSYRCLSLNIKFLDRIKQYWGVFVGMHERLQGVFRFYDDRVRQGELSGNIRLGSLLFQYGDWFENYPHGAKDDAALSQKADLQSVSDYMATLSPQARARHPVKPSKRQKIALAEAEGKKRPLLNSLDQSQQAEDIDGAKGMQHHTQNLDHMEMLGSPYRLPESYDRSQIRPLGVPQAASGLDNPQPIGYATPQTMNILPPIAEMTDLNNFDDGSTLPTMYSNNMPDANEAWNFALPFGQSYMDDIYGGDFPYTDPMGWMFTYNMPQDYMGTDDSIYGTNQATFANIPGAYFVNMDGEASNVDGGNTANGRSDGL